MSKMPTEDRVMHVLENIAMQGLVVTRDSTWDELGLDSLEKIEFLMDLEDEFLVNIPDEVMTVLDNVGEVIDYIERIMK